MRRAVFVTVLGTALIIADAVIGPRASAQAQGVTTAALEGVVSSDSEGRMEGVLVSAKREGAPVTVTVVSNARGGYAFPRSKLQPGEYQLTIRAAGYDLEDPGKVGVKANGPTQLNLKLQPTRNLASQLTSAEWLMSFPGTEEQKKGIDCTGCHTLQRVAESRHDADAWLPALHRMSNYASGGSPLVPRKLPFEVPRNDAGQKRRAEYLSKINLSAVSKWEYPLRTLPRPTGISTNVIFTEYDLPRKESQPHDAAVAPDGMVWYTDFGLPYIGVLNPRTAEIEEYPLPELKPGFPRGSTDIEIDKEGNPWIAMLFQGGIAKFDKKTKKFQVWKIPAEYNDVRSRQGMLALPLKGSKDHRIWFSDNTNLRMHRLDPVSGKIDTFPAFPDHRSGGDEYASEGRGRHSIYGIAVDSQGNGYFTDIQGNNIGKIDAKTGKVTLYPTPGPDAGPRRFFFDPQDRLWFAEYRGSTLGMLDTKTGQFQEWPVPTPYSKPYDVVVDKNGNVWGGGMWTDRVFRFDPKTEQFTEYLLAGSTNIRRVDVDNSTTPVTFWVGSNHGAKLVKLEPLLTVD